MDMGVRETSQDMWRAILHYAINTHVDKILEYKDELNKDANVADYAILVGKHGEIVKALTQLGISDLEADGDKKYFWTPSQTMLYFERPKSNAMEESVIREDNHYEGDVMFA